MAVPQAALPFLRFPIIAPAKVPVREVLDRYGIVPRKRFGQNFLHDPAVARRIVTAAGAARSPTAEAAAPAATACAGTAW